MVNNKRKFTCFFYYKYFLIEFGVTCQTSIYNFITCKCNANHCAHVAKVVFAPYLVRNTANPLQLPNYTVG